MAKTLAEAPLSTRAARSNLAPGLHWRGIDSQVHLGYRRGKRGGEWLVRWRHGAGYRRADVGLADDHIKAGTLDFDAAVRKARKLVEQARIDALAEASGPPLTVRSAVETYVADRDNRESKRAGRPIRSDAGQRLGRYVIGQPARGNRKAIDASPVAEAKLHKLKERDLLAWRNGLPDSLKATTRQRLVNDLKAALNAAYEVNRDRLPPAFPVVVKHGLKAIGDVDHAEPVARDNQILSDGDIGRLLRAARQIDDEQGWEGDLFRMIVVLAATGARFSQIARMRVADCQHKEARLHVPVSRKGRGGKSGHVVIPVGRDVLDALQPVTIGRVADEVLLERWRSRQIGPAKWERIGRGPWQAPSELVRPWHAIRDRAELPGVIPYALRHSSIVRGIRANLPIRLVGALHDTSTAMIERHYSKWITSGLEEMARAAVVPIVPEEGGAKVLELKRRAERGAMVG